MDAAAATAAAAEAPPAPLTAQESGTPQGYSPPDTSTKASPAEPAGGQAPAAQEPGSPTAQRAPQPAVGPLRLIEIGLGALVLVLGLGALWVRRRGR